MGRTCLVVVILVAYFSEYGFCAAVDSSASAMSYLMNYNYLKQQDYTSGALVTQEQVSQAIKAFQRMVNIDQTGKIDDKTMEMMNKPRCGMADITGMGNTMHTRRRRRFALQGSKWPKTDLTYKITRYTPDMSQADVNKEIKRAFKVWSEVTPLTFTESTASRVDIEIIFAPGDHGDGNPFDGPGRVLAHAYFPQFGGDSHFDEAETWTLNTNAGTNLFQVAAHEFGHALGLSHSDVSAALMAPIYTGYQPDFKLHIDDVMGIQRIYGDNPQPPPLPPSVTTEAPMPPPPPTMKPDPKGNPCMDGKIDAIVSTVNDMTYAFRGQHFYYLDPTKGYYFSEPMLISAGWPGLPDNIDAAYTNVRNRKTYFFKGSQYWRFTSRRQLDTGYPKDISRGFRNLPNNIDAAFTWSGNLKLYFIKGDQYWRYDGGNMDGDYPRPLSVWRGLPGRVDGSFYWPSAKRTYFFKDGKYYRYNDIAFRVDPRYPRETAKWWFKCERGNQIDDMPDDGEMSNMDEDMHIAGANVTTTTEVTSGTSQVTMQFVWLNTLIVLLLKYVF